MKEDRKEYYYSNQVYRSQMHGTTDILFIRLNYGDCYAHDVFDQLYLRYNLSSKTLSNQS